MSCQLQAQYFNDYVDNLLSMDSKLDYQQHIAHCAICQNALKAHDNYQQQIKKISVPLLTSERFEQLINHAQHQADKPLNKQRSTTNNPSFLKGFMAASVLFIGLLTGWQYTNTSFAPQVHSQAGNINDITNTAQITETDYLTNVTLTINVPQDMPAADLNLILPENVALQGFEGQAEINWYVDLEKGPNVLSLPIAVKRGSNLEKPLTFIANIAHESSEKDFELSINLLTQTNTI